MFKGGRVLKTLDSKINGKIEVRKSLAFGTYISVGGLTQSGGVVYEIWKKTLKRLKKKNFFLNSCLILGSGGGSVLRVVKKYWPEAKITGVEVDFQMVSLGREFLGLNDSNSDIKITDAFSFCEKVLEKKEKFDLVIVDLYLGDRFPEKFDSLEFISLVKKIFSKEGLVIFNKLYYGEKRKESLNFAKKLEKVFEKLEYFYPEANLMLICS